MHKALFFTVFFLFSPLLSAEIMIKDAWVKNAPPVAPARAAYMTIINNGDQSIKIEKISTPQFNMAELHETVNKNGVFSMHELKQLVIPAQGAVHFKPQGKHVMLMMPAVPLTDLKQVELHILDSNNHTTTVIAPIKDSL